MSDVPHITQNFARPSYRPQGPAGMDPEMRRMAMVAAGFGGILAVVIGAMSFSGHRAHHGLPVIQPPATPVRVKPANPGGMQVMGADDIATPGTEKLAPPAERPAIRALHAKSIEKVRLGTVIDKLPAPKKPAVVLPPPAPAPVIQAPAPAGTSVQLAAFDSQQAAEQDWGKMAEKMPKMFDGHKPEVMQAHLAGRAVYRLRTGGFPTVAAAQAFCTQVRAKGGDCSIAKF